MIEQQFRMSEKHLPIINIEYCSNCGSHSWCTHHNEDRYRQTFTKISKIIRKYFPQVTVKGNQLPKNLVPIKASENKYFDAAKNKYVFFPSVGAFQITLEGQTLFSKKVHNNWPSIEELLDQISLRIHGKARQHPANEVEIFTEEETITMANSYINNAENRKTLHRNQSHPKKDNFTMSQHFKLYSKDKGQAKDYYAEFQNVDPKKYKSFFRQSQNPSSKSKPYVSENQGTKEVLIRLDSIEEQNFHQEFNRLPSRPQIVTMKQWNQDLNELEKKFQHFQQKVTTIHRQSKKFELTPQLENSNVLAKSRNKENQQTGKSPKNSHRAAQDRLAGKITEVNDIYKTFLFQKGKHKKLSKIQQFLQSSGKQKNKVLKKIYGMKKDGSNHLPLRKMVRKWNCFRRSQGTHESDLDGNSITVSSDRRRSHSQESSEQNSSEAQSQSEAHEMPRGISLASVARKNSAKAKISSHPFKENEVSKKTQIKKTIKDNNKQQQDGINGTFGLQKKNVSKNKSPNDRQISTVKNRGDHSHSENIVNHNNRKKKRALQFTTKNEITIKKVPSYTVNDKYLNKSSKEQFKTKKLIPQQFSLQSDKGKLQGLQQIHKHSLKKDKSYNQVRPKKLYHQNEAASIQNSSKQSNPPIQQNIKSKNFRMRKNQQKQLNHSKPKRNVRHSPQQQKNKRLSAQTKGELQKPKKIKKNKQTIQKVNFKKKPQSSAQQEQNVFTSTSPLKEAQDSMSEKEHSNESDNLENQERQLQTKKSKTHQKFHENDKIQQKVKASERKGKGKLFATQDNFRTEKSQQNRSKQQKATRKNNNENLSSSKNQLQMKNNTNDQIMKNDSGHQNEIQVAKQDFFQIKQVENRISEISQNESQHMDNASQQQRDEVYEEQQSRSIADKQKAKKVSFSGCEQEERMSQLTGRKKGVARQSGGSKQNTHKKEKSLTRKSESVRLEALSSEQGENRSYRHRSACFQQNEKQQQEINHNFTQRTPLLRNSKMNNRSSINRFRNSTKRQTKMSMCSRQSEPFMPEINSPEVIKDIYGRSPTINGSQRGSILRKSEYVTQRKPSMEQYAIKVSRPHYSTERNSENLSQKRRKSQKSRSASVCFKPKYSKFKKETIKNKNQRPQFSQQNSQYSDQEADERQTKRSKGRLSVKNHKKSEKLGNSRMSERVSKNRSKYGQTAKLRKSQSIAKPKRNKSKSVRSLLNDSKENLAQRVSLSKSKKSMKSVSKKSKKSKKVHKQKKSVREYSFMYEQNPKDNVGAIRMEKKERMSKVQMLSVGVQKTEAIERSMQTDSAQPLRNSRVKSHSQNPGLNFQRVDTQHKRETADKFYRTTDQFSESSHERALIQKQLYGDLIIKQQRRYESVLRGHIDFDTTQPETQLKSAGQIWKPLNSISDRPIFDSRAIKAEEVTHNKHNPVAFRKIIKMLVERNEFLIIRLFENIAQTDLGFYAVWICDHYDWKCVIVNEWVSVDENDIPLYSFHKENQLWPVILEKALALVLGGYQQLMQASTSKLFHMLTGSNFIEFTIREDPSKNQRFLRFVAESEKKNFIIHAEKQSSCLEEQHHSEKETHVFYILGKKTLNDSEILLKMKEENREPFMVKLEKFSRQFRTAEILHLRVNHNFTSIRLPDTKRECSLAVFEAVFAESSFGCFTLSNKKLCNLKCYLYREEEASVLRLIGQAKEKNRTQLFFDCCFQEGKYYIFAECDETGSTLSYCGEGKPSLSLKEKINETGLKNDYTEYIPISKVPERAMDTMPKLISLNGDNLYASRSNGSQMMMGSRMSNRENRTLDELREHFVQFLLGSRK